MRGCCCAAPRAHGGEGGAAAHHGRAMRVLVVRAESVTAQLEHPRLQFVALRIIAHAGGEAREDGEHLGAEGVVGAEGSLAEAELVVEEGLALLAGRVLVVAHQQHLCMEHVGRVRALG